MKVNVISLQKDNESLMFKIMQDLNNKHNGNKEQFLNRIDVYCLEIANDRQCQFRRENDDLYFFHKYSNIDIDKYLLNERNKTK